MLAHTQINQYQEQGYLIVSKLFSPDEIEFFKAHYEAMRLREGGEQNQSLSEGDYTENDPLLVYPRLMMPHRRDEASLAWLIDNRLNQCMIDLLGREPYAVQTMFYFKPPGARGQAMHQDQYYLRVQPGTCMAAWMAVDDGDEENGCLQVVPGSHAWPLLCSVEADKGVSFSDVSVPLPDGVEAAPVLMKAGDVFFFNGQIVHGSLPNRTTDRFRRALIGHYIVGEAKQVYQWYHPVLRMDGSEVTLATSDVGGTCGTWVDQDGLAELEMQVEIVNRHIFK